MYLKSEIGFNLMVGVRVCEYWRNLKIQGLAESITLFQFIVMFIFVVYVNWIFFFIQPLSWRESFIHCCFHYYVHWAVCWVLRL